MLAGMMRPVRLMIATFIAHLIIHGMIKSPSLSISSMTLKPCLCAASFADIYVHATDLAVLGSLLSGLASPTEAAALGAVNALILHSIYGVFSRTKLRESLRITVRISAMIPIIVTAEAIAIIVIQTSFLTPPLEMT